MTVVVTVVITVVIIVVRTVVITVVRTVVIVVVIVVVITVVITLVINGRCSSCWNDRYSSCHDGRYSSGRNSHCSTTVTRRVPQPSSSRSCLQHAPDRRGASENWIFPSVSQWGGQQPARVVFILFLFCDRPPPLGHTEFRR